MNKSLIRNQEIYDAIPPSIFQFPSLGKELFHIHFTVENQSVRISDSWMFIHIKEIFPKEKLNILELLHPNPLRKIAERTIIFITWEGSIHLAQVAVLNVLCRAAMLRRETGTMTFASAGLKRYQMFR